MTSERAKGGNEHKKQHKKQTLNSSPESAKRETDKALTCFFAKRSVPLKSLGPNMYPQMGATPSNSRAQPLIMLFRIG